MFGSRQRYSHTFRTTRREAYTFSRDFTEHTLLPSRLHRICLVKAELWTEPLDRSINTASPRMSGR